MVKEEQYEKTVEIQSVSDRVMAVVLVLEVDMLRLICRYVLQSGRRFEEKKST